MLDTLEEISALDLRSEGDRYRFRQATMLADLNGRRDSVVVSNEDSMEPGVVDTVFSSLGDGKSYLSLIEDDIPDHRKTYIAMDPSGGEEERLGHAMMDTDSKKNNLKSWTKDHPEAWTPVQILDWLYYTAQVRQLKGDICGEAFNAMNGQQLCGLSRQDFMMLEPNFGEVYYETLKELLKQADFRAPEPCSPGIHVPDSMLGALHEQHYHQTPYIDLTTCTPTTDQQLHRQQYPPHHHHHQPGIMERHHHQYQHQHHHHHQQQHHQQLAQDIDFPPSQEEYINYDFDPHDAFQDVTEAHESSGYESDVSGSSSSSQLDRQLSDQSGDGYGFTACFTTGYSNSMRAPRVNQPVRRRPGRPPTKNGTERKPNHRGRRPGHTSKGNHLWEFVREMLKDSDCNPSLIRWEDKAEGVFRFMQSEMVAKKWGEKKKNPGMTYEKLSRAMRFCRSAGYFAMVPKTGKFPKKLCFKFGEKASDWS